MWNSKTAIRAENRLQQLSVHSTLAQIFSEAYANLNLLPQGEQQKQLKGAQTQHS